jgi:phage N-6-adenine-methyltransferase
MAIGKQRHPIFTSDEEKYETPRWLFDLLDAEFHFTLDVCATAESAKCDRFFSPEVNGLLQNWQGACWMNPPYGKGLGQWLKKAWQASREGATVVGLVPARTDTRWFHGYVLGKAEIRFVEGRLIFNGFTQARSEKPNYAPFPSLVLIYRPSGDVGVGLVARRCPPDRQSG